MVRWIPLMLAACMLLFNMACFLFGVWGAVLILRAMGAL